MNPEIDSSSENAAPQPDLLIVLGKNIGVNSTVADIQQDNWNLSTDSRLNVLAAAGLYKPGMHFLFTGGKTAGENVASEAAAMHKYFVGHFPDIPAENILLEEQSIDTAGNAEEVAGILRHKDYRHIGLLSSGHHVGNAVKLFKRYGVPVESTFTTEDVIKERSERHEAYIVAWAGLDRVKKERTKEHVRSLLLSTIDRKGRLVRQLTQRSRG